MVTLPVFYGNQRVNKGHFFFMGRFPLINAGVIELENHLFQALKGNNGSRQQSSRTGNFIMKG